MSIADDLAKSTAKVTKKWKRQRTSEIRNSQKRFRRNEAFTRERSEYQSEAAREVIPQAYLKASGKTGIAKARQIFYAARDEIQERTGKTLNSVYFTQTLLPQFMNDYPELVKDWKVVYDARGHLVAEDREGKAYAWSTSRKRYRPLDAPPTFANITPSLRGHGVAGRLWTRDRVGDSDRDG